MRKCSNSNHHWQVFLSTVILIGLRLWYWTCSNATEGLHSLCAIIYIMIDKDKIFHFCDLYNWWWIIIVLPECTISCLISTLCSSAADHLLHYQETWVVFLFLMILIIYMNRWDINETEERWRCAANIRLTSTDGCYTY